MTRIKICLWVLMANGAICLAMACATQPAIRAAVLLDHVLEPDELRDPVKVAETQLILDRAAQGYVWLMFLAYGAVTVLASGYGLIAASREPNGLSGAGGSEDSAIA